MSEHQTPRVDGSNLESYANRTVRIIGRVEEVGNEVVFYTPSLASSNLKINLIPSNDLEDFEKGIWYEIIGRVSEDLKVRVIDIKNFGDNIDENSVAGLVKYSQKASEIFHN